MTEWIDYGPFQTKNARLQEVLKAAEKTAALQAPLYICGQMGTGRRTLARWIHDRSLQRNGRFVSWTAEESPGLTGGETLLVEAIDELAPVALLKLRKLLEDPTTSTEKVRWIVTSGTKVADWMETSNLARELAYRLCRISFEMPSLQERAEDLQGLVSMFQKVSCLVNGIPEKSLSAEAMQTLMSRTWPGNVSELNNAVERAILLADAPVIGQRELSFLNAAPTSSVDEGLRLAQAGMTLFEMEKKLIFQTLEMTRQNKTRAAQILGISIRTIRNKLNLYRDGGDLDVSTL